jgi:hypothetical protein
MTQKGIQEPVIITFGRLDPKALGSAISLVFGTVLFLATIVLVLRSGPIVGPTLSLLSQYFPGYSVTWRGAILGLFYGALCGFLFGYGFAQLRNSIAHLFLLFIKRRAERATISDLL